MSILNKTAIACMLIGLILSAETIVNAQDARIKIDVDRTIGEVHEHLYGNFTEHLGRHIYGGIYDPESPLADENESKWWICYFI